MPAQGGGPISYDAVVRYDPFRHHRRSIRLPGHDYSTPGAYFITICAYGHECLFANVIDAKARLSPYGEIVREEWERSATLRPTITLDAFAVMPNHLHGVVALQEDSSVGAHSCAPLRAAHPNAPLQRRTRSVSSFVAQFKASAARRINALRGTRRAPVWQRNYYEHIIRDEADLERIRFYIQDNPNRWPEDEYHQ